MLVKPRNKSRIVQKCLTFSECSRGLNTDSCGLGDNIFKNVSGSSL